MVSVLVKYIAARYCHEDSLPCSMMGFCFYATTGSVLYIQAFLAATRYILVCSSWRMTPASTILISSLVSLLPYLIFTFPLFQVWGRFGYESGTGEFFARLGDIFHPNKSLGTCTIKPGSFKSFIMIFGPSVPYIIIIFSYVMIVRKYRISRDKVMQNSASVKSRTSLGGGRLSVMETSFFPSPGRPQSVYTSCTLSVPDTSRRVSEDDISMCEMTNDLLERTQTERRRRRRRQEGDMNMTVMIICVSFVICHLPACLVLVFDPSANKFPQVIKSRTNNVYTL